MLCRMPPVVQHEAPELALPDVSPHVLSRPLKMAVLLGPVACLLYHRNACNTQENGYAMVLRPRNIRSTAILRGRFFGESLDLREIREFSPESRI